MTDREEQDDRSMAEQFSGTNPNLFMQFFLAGIESGKSFAELNKDFGYTRLTAEQIALMEFRFNIFRKISHRIKELSDYEGRPLKNIGDYLDFSSLKIILGKNTDTAILNQSRDGWGRELAVTQRFVAKGMDKQKAKWFGLKKEKSEDDI